MNHFFIAANPIKDPGGKVAKAAAEFLRENGCICTVCLEEIFKDKIPPDAECMIVLGGDGTIIRAAGELGGRKTPLLGVNLGTLGYLAETDREGLYAALSRLIKDDYLVDERMMLSGTIVRDGKPVMTGTALNEILVTRGATVRTIHLNIYVNGEYLNRYDADGIITATPTGSTAYNLSAGGPIVEPNSSIVVLTPVSPHTLNNRSIILSASNHISIRTEEKPGESPIPCLAVFDGMQVEELKEGDSLEIDRSSHVTRIIRMSKKSFLETLRNKMSD